MLAQEGEDPIFELAFRVRHDCLGGTRLASSLDVAKPVTRPVQLLRVPAAAWRFRRLVERARNLSQEESGTGPVCRYLPICGKGCSVVDFSEAVTHNSPVISSPLDLPSWPGRGYFLPQPDA